MILRPVSLLAGVGLALALASSLAAADPAQPAFEPLPGIADFISPAGEPFHSPDRLSGAEHWFASADANHDGRLSYAEYRADAMRFFDRLDSDKSGQIEPNEIERYETVIAPEIRVESTVPEYIPSSGDSGSDQKSPPYPTRLGAGRYSYIDIAEPIVSMDTNLDRGISRLEFERAIKSRFIVLDANGDGAITRDELPKISVPGGRRGKRHRGD
jgi:Ca2+-binding EF-hand superfamily protein